MIPTRTLGQGLVTDSPLFAQNGDLRRAGRGSPRPKPTYLPALRRATRVLRSNLRCFFLAIRLRRFLMTEPMRVTLQCCVRPRGKAAASTMEYKRAPQDEEMSGPPARRIAGPGPSYRPQDWLKSPATVALGCRQQPRNVTRRR